MNIDPCPFCGNENPILMCAPKSEQLFSPRFYVLCEYTGLEKGCGAAGPEHKSRELAIEAWNTRTPDWQARALEAEREVLQLRSQANSEAEELDLKLSTALAAIVVKDEALRQTVEEIESIASAKYLEGYERNFKNLFFRITGFKTAIKAALSIRAIGDNRLLGITVPKHSSIEKEKQK